MSEELHQTIKEIKKQFRLSMNGVVSTHQRRQGLDYKINFGVEIPRLKEIASGYAKDKALAEELWKDNIRECRMLAIFLYPREEFSDETAERWMSECRFTEIADNLCHRLLVHVASPVAFALRQIKGGDAMCKYCGYSMLAHLFRSGLPVTAEEEADYLSAVRLALTDTGLVSTVKNAASISLMKYAGEDEARVSKVREALAGAAGEENPAISLLLENIGAF